MHIRFLLTLSAFAAASLANVVVRKNAPIKQTLEFDNLKVPLNTLELIEEYEKVKFNAFNLANNQATLIGPISPSAPNVIATSFRTRLLGGLLQNPNGLLTLKPLTTPGNFTVEYPGSPYESMDLVSLIFAALVGTPIATVAIPFQGKVTFRSYYANGVAAGHLTVPFSNTYAGTGLRVKYDEVVFGEKFRGISTVSVEYSSILIQKLLEPILSITLDNIELALNPKKQ